jgi:hypothetical protein
MTPWTLLGTLLVEGGAITEQQLTTALRLQDESGQRLGHILIERGWVSETTLAEALATQLGVNGEATVSPLPAKTDRRPDDWKPIGQLLVEKGLVTQADVERALAVQLRTRRRLGAILVSQKLLSMEQLTRVIADQHGLDLTTRSLRSTSVREVPAPDPA